MITSEIRTFKYTDDNIQKVQCVRLDSFEELNFFRPVFSGEAFERLFHLYRDFIIRKYSFIFGKIVLFHLPEDMGVPFEVTSGLYGHIYDPLSVVAMAFKKNIYVKKGVLCFSDSVTERFFYELEKRGALYIAAGKLNTLSFLPVSHGIGFLSETHRDAAVKFNSSFFVMDMLDCATVFDHVGKPVGLNLKNGRVLTAPLFDREALLVDRNGKVTVRPISLTEVGIVIDGKEYRHGLNCTYYYRPQYAITPSGGFDIVISDGKIVAVKKGGKCPVPSSGFIIKTDEPVEVRNRAVQFTGFEEYAFAIQVGNSAIIEGKKTENFISPFHNFLKPLSNAYPPSMYPLNYHKDRAPRMVLGSDINNKPVILWLEGAGKFGYEAGKDSCGASLNEVASLCETLGLYNAVNLDGGGSAQILLNGERQLKMSDRGPVNYSEQERGVAIGLYVE